MIFSNGLKKTPICIKNEKKHFDALETTFSTGANVLRFLQRSSNAGPFLTPVIHFTKHIPALSGNILELHFDKQKNSVDFATRLNVDFDKPLIEKLKCEHCHLPFLSEAFSPLIEQKGNGFNHGIENIWIEYDAPFRNTPALFFDINRREAFCPRSAYANLYEVTGVFGRQINTELLGFLEQIKEAGLYVVYYGLMFSRRATAIRLTINGIRSEHLADTLEQLGWKGDYEAVKKITDTYLTTAQKLVVGVDFEKRFENRIGIEVFDDNNAPLIRALKKNNEISKSHAELLNAWEQNFMLPDYLAMALTELHQRPVDRICARLNHFKFVVNNIDAIAAKAYLYYCF